MTALNLRPLAAELELIDRQAEAVRDEFVELLRARIELGQRMAEEAWLELIRLNPEAAEAYTILTPHSPEKRDAVLTVSGAAVTRGDFVAAAERDLKPGDVVEVSGHGPWESGLVVPMPEAVDQVRICADEVKGIFEPLSPLVIEDHPEKGADDDLAAGLGQMLPRSTEYGPEAAGDQPESKDQPKRRRSLRARAAEKKRTIISAKNLVKRLVDILLEEKGALEFNELLDRLDGGNAELRQELIGPVRNALVNSCLFLTIGPRMDDVWALRRAQ